MGSRQVPSQIRKFKGETVFDWEAEPSDERPTEFGSSTQFSSTTGYSHLTGYSQLSGYSTLESERRSSRPRRRTRRSGSIWVPATLVFAFAVSGLLGLAHYLHR